MTNLREGCERKSFFSSFTKKIEAGSLTRCLLRDTPKQ
jgi:hypothetical protein